MFANQKRSVLNDIYHLAQFHTLSSTI